MQRVNLLDAILDRTARNDGFTGGNDERIQFPNRDADLLVPSGCGHRGGYRVRRSCRRARRMRLSLGRLHDSRSYLSG